MRALFKSFCKDQGGNVAMIFAMLTTVFLGGIALAVDMSRAMNLRSQLNDIADAAALAGAYVASTDKRGRKQAVKSAIEFHLTNLGADVQLKKPKIDFNDQTEEVTVTLVSNQKSKFANILGFKKLKPVGASVASYAINDVTPVSMAFVLDVSGSMGWTSKSGGIKIDLLKQSVTTLFDALEDAAPSPDVLKNKIRTGMTAYNSAIVPAHTVQMSYGWTDVEREVASLLAGGGTNSTMAFDESYKLINNDTPKPADLKEFIIFMTDGSNNDPAESTKTIALCDAAKSQGILIYSIAFEAPKDGKELLQECASSNGATGHNGDDDDDDDDNKKKDKYYFNAKNGKQLKAAFKKIGEDIGKLDTRIVR